MSTSRYSRMWRAGFSNDMPNTFSMTIWCDKPMPSVRRPPLAACTVRAWAASITGWRGIGRHHRGPELDRRDVAGHGGQRGQGVVSRRSGTPTPPRSRTRPGRPPGTPRRRRASRCRTSRRCASLPRSLVAADRRPGRVRSTGWTVGRCHTVPGSRSRGRPQRRRGCETGARVGQNTRHVRRHPHGKFLRRVRHGRRRPAPALLRRPRRDPGPVGPPHPRRHRRLRPRCGRSAASRWSSPPPVGPPTWPGWWPPPPRCPSSACPSPWPTWQGLDSLLAMVQMPKGIPVATVAINGARNAALLAIRIMALSDPRLASELDTLHRQLGRAGPGHGRRSRRQVRPVAPRPPGTQPGQPHSRAYTRTCSSFQDPAREGPCSAPISAPPEGR